MHNFMKILTIKVVSVREALDGKQVFAVVRMCQGENFSFNILKVCFTAGSQQEREELEKR
jgi:hypothetical protein